MNRERDFRERSLGFWTWAKWIGVTFSLTIYIIYSTFELWRDLFWMSVLGAVAIVVCSWYATGHTREIEPGVRQKGLVAIWIMYGAMIFNVAMHGAASRDVANAAKLRAEQIEQQDRAQEAKDREAKRLADVLTAQRQADQAATRRAEAEASLARQAGVAPRAPRSTGSRNVDLSGLHTDINAPAELQSAARVADGWFWWVFCGFLLELIAGIAGASMVHHERTRDDNANGVPEWIERLYRMNPAIVEQRFPDFYRILSGAKENGKSEFPKELDTSGPK